MDIIEMAKERERQKESFYRGLSSKASRQGLKKVLDLLADEEAKHFRIVEAMAAGMTEVPVMESHVLEEARSAFLDMKKAREAFSLPDTEIDLYRQARDMEEQAEQFYRTGVKKTKDPAAAGVFLALAAEERKHYVLAANLLEFVSRPLEWLENAEFFHRDDY